MVLPHSVLCGRARKPASRRKAAQMDVLVRVLELRPLRIRLVRSPLDSLETYRRALPELGERQTVNRLHLGKLCSTTPLLPLERQAHSRDRGGYDRQGETRMV